MKNYLENNGYEQKTSYFWQKQLVSNFVIEVEIYEDANDIVIYLYNKNVQSFIEKFHYTFTFYPSKHDNLIHFLEISVYDIIDKLVEIENIVKECNYSA